MSKTLDPNPTFVLGEDDGGTSLTKGEDLTTLALGEEEPIYTTLALGEEDGGSTTSGLRGEEDLSTSLRGEEDGGLSPLDPTLQNPFGGF